MEREAESKNISITFLLEKILLQSARDVEKQKESSVDGGIGSKSEQRGRRHWAGDLSRLSSADSDHSRPPSNIDLLFIDDIPLSVEKDIQ